MTPTRDADALNPLQLRLAAAIASRHCAAHSGGVEDCAGRLAGYHAVAVWCAADVNFTTAALAANPSTGR
jgi:hypothetical protein